MSPLIVLGQAESPRRVDCSDPPRAFYVEMVKSCLVHFQRVHQAKLPAFSARHVFFDAESKAGKLHIYF